MRHPPSLPSATRRRRKRRFTLRGVAFAALILAFSLLLSEGVVRIFGAGGTTLTRGRLHAYDPEAGWICAPNLNVRYAQPDSFDVQVLTNSRGLRDQEHSLSKPDDVIRIACLGDSFMWGYGVENDEMISTLLERSVTGSETINLGANGYSTVQSLVRLETEALRYDPDWAVLAFCWNDLEDNFDDKDGGRPALRIGAASPHIVNRPVRRPWKSPAKQWLRQHSRLFSFGEYWLELTKRQLKSSRRVAELASRNPERPAPRPGEPHASATDRSLPPPNDVAVNEDDLQLSRLEVASGLGAPVERAWRGERWLIEQLRDAMDDAGGRLMVVYVTQREDVDDELLARWTASLPPSEAVDRLDPHRAADQLGSICAELGVPYVDLVPAFEQHGDPAGLFLHENGHWSAAGHELAARAVALRLSSLAGL